ncbi:MAG: glycosyltransferase family 2 protein [Erysipelotrichaceae bacterium]
MSKSGDNLVSVVIATYKRDDALRNALHSLTTQTYKNFEVVLVDDNDNSEWTAKVQGIVNSFSSLLNINYLINEHNMGSAATRNRGIAKAKGKYITFLDDDDVYLPQKIEMQLKDMVASDADYGITDLYLYNEKDELIDKRIRSYIKSTKTNDLMRYHLLQHMTGTDTFMFKTEYLRRIGGFPGIDVGDEFYLMKEAILAEGKFFYSPHCYIKAYVHSGEMNGLSSGESKINGENALFQEKKKYFNYLSDKDIRYVEMRHYAVIAFAEMRRRNMGAFVANASKAFFTAPVACVKMFFEHK